MPRSAVDKRDRARPPSIEVQAEPRPGWPAGRMLIASPLALQAVMATVPAGRVLRLGDLRAALARAWGADFTCPLTTGIFWRIVAEAADEDRAAGRACDAPWWRVVRDDGALNDKLPGGRARHAALLAAEGVALTARGRVAGLEEAAWAP